MQYTAVIVGLGNIGMGYDKALPRETHVLSHARAFSLHPDFDLVGGVDPDTAMRTEFSNSYATAAFASIEELLAEVKPDVVALASPTSSHSAMLAAILARYTPRAILCEKPLAPDSFAAHEMVEMCNAMKVPLYVNFIRRADPAVLEVKQRLNSGKIALPFKAVVWYSKGLLHNGSHFVDLLTFWFGPVRSMQVISSGRSCGHDAEPDVRFGFDQGSAVFCAADEEHFSHYTVEVVAANGRLRYEPGGKIAWQTAQPHPTLAAYRQLCDTQECIPDDMARYQYRIVDQLAGALRGLSHTLCSGQWALENQEWIERAIVGRSGETCHG